MTNRSRWLLIAAGVLAGLAVAPSAIRRTQATQVMERVRAAVTVPVDSISVRREERVLRVYPRPVVGRTLAQYRELERALAVPAQPWQVFVIPPVPPRMHIRFGTDSVTAAVPVVADAELVMWAVQRSGASSLAIEGLAGGSPDSAAHALARLRADQIAAAFDGMALDVSVRAVHSDTVRALEREGGAERLHGVDVLAGFTRRAP